MNTAIAPKKTPFRTRVEKMSREFSVSEQYVTSLYDDTRRTVDTTHPQFYGIVWARMRQTLERR